MTNPRDPSTYGLGRRPHWDIRNESFPLALSSPGAIARKALRTMQRALTRNPLRRWRYWSPAPHWNYQNGYPACTAYAAVTLIACDPVHQAPSYLRSLDPMQWYRDNVAFDRAHGRDFNGGATTIATMETGIRYGVFSRYEWAGSLDDAFTWVHNIAPIIFGTEWYPAMWERDAEGIVRKIPAGQRSAGGHDWCANARDNKRGLTRYESTWDDGEYWMPDEIMERLWKEDGEAGFPYEVKMPATLAA